MFETFAYFVVMYLTFCMNQHGYDDVTMLIVYKFSNDEDFKKI